MNILIVKLSALGDVVQAIPTFEALRQQYPTDHISWLAEEENADLLLHYPRLDEVLVCQRRLWERQLRSPASWPTAIRNLFRFCSCLRQRRYDIIIDLQGLLKSAIWVALAKGTRKIGFDGTREGSWIVLNERLSAYDADRHALERYLDIARYLGARVNSVRIQDPWTTDEEHRFENRLNQVLRDGTVPLVACHPMGRWLTKLWPEGHFACLARELVKKLGVTIIFTGGSGDRDTVSRLIHLAGTNRLLNWAGTTNLRELAYLYKQAAVVVSTDSGPMHLAAALGTPVVALFGPTAPWRTGPYGDGHRVLRAGLDCSPCFQRTCDTMECMEKITVDKVFQAVTDQLQKWREGHAKRTDIEQRKTNYYSKAQDNSKY